MDRGSRWLSSIFHSPSSVETQPQQNKTQCSERNCPQEPVAKQHIERFALENFYLSFKHSRRKDRQCLSQLSPGVDHRGNAGVSDPEQSAPGFNGAPLAEPR